MCVRLHGFWTVKWRGGLKRTMMLRCMMCGNLWNFIIHIEGALSGGCCRELIGRLLKKGGLRYCLGHLHWPWSYQGKKTDSQDVCRVVHTLKKMGEKFKGNMTQYVLSSPPLCAGTLVCGDHQARGKFRPWAKFPIQWFAFLIHSRGTYTLIYIVMHTALLSKVEKISNGAICWTKPDGRINESKFINKFWCIIWYYQEKHIVIG